jgi:hypothetical protein
MSEPEIARRCLNCGASVRGRALFCPQCGRPMGDGEAAGAEAAAPPPAEGAGPAAASVGGRPGGAPAAGPESSSGSRGRARAVEGDAARQSAVTPETAARITGAPAGAPSEAAPDAGEVRAGDGATARGAGARGVRGRAAAVGASVGGNLKPRVERLREASSGVLDEAADDPGVRFLVIAAVLFLLFLLLWLLSFTLG